MASQPELSHDQQDSLAEVVSTVVTAAARASPDLADIARRAALLRAIADALDANREHIIATAAGETRLTPTELTPEHARTVGVLRQFAAYITTPDTFRPALSPPASGADPSPIGPNHALESRLVPLGRVVAVFGASNFPLAYGVMGTDASSALAAGCAVVIKEHPAHTATGRLIHSLAQHAAEACRIAPAVIGYLRNEDPRDFAPARALIAHPDIAAVGFTGSLAGGNAIAALARERTRPIPAFCEMGSANPIYITAAAMRERPAEIAAALAPSILTRVGQQCTRPGLILCLASENDILESPLTRGLIAAFNATPPREMLAPWIAASYQKRLRDCAACRGVRILAGPSPDAPQATPRHAAPTLLFASAAAMAQPDTRDTLRDEIFGPAAIITPAASIDTLPVFHPSLTATIWTAADAAQDLDVPALLARAIASAGRVILNGVPTGVRVADAMVHGGPYPATNQPHATAVGPRALERWMRPVCLQAWGSPTPW